MPSCRCSPVSSQASPVAHRPVRVIAQAQKPPSRKLIKKALAESSTHQLMRSSICDFSRNGQRTSREGRQYAKLSRKDMISLVVSMPLIMGGPAVATTKAEELAEMKAQIEAQKDMLEYKLEQQRLAKKAEAEAKKQLVEEKAREVEEQIMLRITADKAEGTAASKAEAAKLEAAIAEIEKVKAETEYNIQQDENLEEAKVIEKEQLIEREAQEMEENITKSINEFLSRVEDM